MLGLEHINIVDGDVNTGRATGENLASLYYRIVVEKYHITKGILHTDGAANCKSMGSLLMKQGHIAEWVWCFEHRFELCVKAALGLNILASLRSRVSALISVLRRPLVVNSYITEQLKFRLPC